MGHASQAYLFHLESDKTVTLQAQLRRRLVAAILDGQIPAGSALPSCRALARSLKIARNTVVLTYQDLVEEGYLVSRERSGFYVNPDILRNRAGLPPRVAAPAAMPPKGELAGHDASNRNGPDWSKRLKRVPSGQRSIVKPQNWADQPFPFIYGQVDQNIFPLSAWRECSRQALSIDSVRDWSKDRFTEDDPMLVEQIRARLLPRRGVLVQPDEILVTVGAQNALYLLVSLLFDETTRFGIEDPGYTDARNIAALRTNHITGLNVDDQGLVVDARLQGCDYVYTTPSHQFPTTVTMTMERRRALLAAARRDDFIIIEDDYESEIAHTGTPQPALKSLDSHDRVIFIASLSKTLAPGLRLGYMVGPSALIREARALRRLMLRHPAANNQRTVALFLADGHYDGLLRRLCHTYRDRLLEASATLARYLPDFTVNAAAGGSALWLKGPPQLDMTAVEAEALKRGVVIESGRVHFHQQANAADPLPRDRSCYCRLGVSSIPIERIEPGIKILAEVVREQLKRS